ncbi:hypothetical protein WJX84_004233 [Apatococcus fuscideae]
MQVTEANEGGARIAQVPTLFYLAHCEAALCCSLLQANATASTLHNVAILGNSLAMSSTKRHLSAAQRSLMKQACKQEIAIPELDMHAGGAFNDLALHILQNIPKPPG